MIEEIRKDVTIHERIKDGKKFYEHFGESSKDSRTYGQ